MRKTVVMLAGAFALCAQGAWYWPFGTDEDSTNAPPRLHRLLEPANDYIELAQDASLDGDTAKALENYRLALEEEERPGRYYPVLEENDWTTIMSSKDLCMIDHLKDLQEAGVDTLKIEGRMKSIYYVASVTRAYRKALDHLYDPSVDYLPYREELFNVSHREFSTGFFFGKGPIDVDEPDPLVMNDDINKPTTGGYLRDYLFLGTVRQEVAPGVYSVDIKNQIRSGETIEFIGPDVLFIREPEVEVLDQDMRHAEHIDHCKTGYIRTSAKIRDGYIIRKEIRL